MVTRTAKEQNRTAAIGTDRIVCKAGSIIHFCRALSVCPIRQPHAAAADSRLRARRAEILIDCYTAGVVKTERAVLTYPGAFCPRVVLTGNPVQAWRAGVRLLAHTAAARRYSLAE